VTTRAVMLTTPGAAAAYTAAARGAALPAATVAGACCATTVVTCSGPGNAPVANKMPVNAPATTNPAAAADSSSHGVRRLPDGG
jgi:hypothetical protein